MARDIEGMSELEFELEDSENEPDKEEEISQELEQNFSQESDREERYEFEDRENESDREDKIGLEMEQDIAQEREAESFEFEDRESVYEKADEYGGATDRVSYYGNKLYEISEREFETESELDGEIQGVLNEMERDFFFDGLWKKLKQGGKWLAKKAVNAAKGLPAFQAIKGITQLARGDLKGILGTLAKAGMGSILSAIPGGAVALPALKAMGIGFEVSDDPDAKRRVLYNIADVSKEAFEYLARNLNEKAYDPIEANRLAANAFQYGLKNARSRNLPSRMEGVKYEKKSRQIEVRKGQKIRFKVVGLGGAVPIICQHVGKNGQNVVSIRGA